MLAFDDTAAQLTMPRYRGNTCSIPTLQGMEQVLKFCKQFTAAVKWVHDHDIIHRDIKPHNIFIDDFDCWQTSFKLGDCGLASRRGSSHEWGGTEGFAPEMGLGLTQNDAGL